MINWKPTAPPFQQNKKKLLQDAIKTSDFIYQIGETDNLRKPSKAVQLKEINTTKFQQKISYVKKCLLRYKKLTGMGRGISAVQVGIPERFFVMFTPGANNDGLLVIINPKVAAVSKTLLSFPEMCMSASPLITKVVRPAWLECLYVDEHGNNQIWSSKNNMSNRVLQHELDHVDGIINIDKVSANSLVFAFDPKFYANAVFKKVT